MCTSEPQPESKSISGNCVFRIQVLYAGKSKTGGKQRQRARRPDQTRHIQASTIKNKLSSLKHFIKFKVQRKCFIDLNKVQLQDLKAKSNELRSNFKNLCKGREKKHKGL